MQKKTCFGQYLGDILLAPVGSGRLTFDLPVSLIDKITRTRRGHGLGSASEVGGRQS
jgi:hypothetical protein